MKKQISVIIPAYNEQARIRNTIEKIVKYLKKNNYDYELLIVDDASSDNTSNIVKKLAIRDRNIKLLKNKINKGKGYSVKKGILNSKKPLILFLDADFSTPIEELRKFAIYLDRYSIIIGSRRLKGSNIVIKQPFYREFAGRVFNLFVRLLIVDGMNDTQCGFKLFKKDIATKIFSKQRLNGFGFDVEILFLAKKFGYKVKDIPVTWKDSAKHSKVNAIKHSIAMFFDLLKIRFNNIFQLY